jgi:hypothetical protein
MIHTRGYLQHIRIQVYAYVYIHTHIRTYTRIHIDTCIYDTHSWVPVTYMHTITCLCIHIYTHTCIYICIYTRVHIRTRIHKNTCICRNKLASFLDPGPISSTHPNHWCYATANYGYDRPVIFSIGVPFSSYSCGKNDSDSGTQVKLSFAFMFL